jgi:hypothetical protein
MPGARPSTLPIVRRLIATTATAALVAGLVPAAGAPASATTPAASAPAATPATAPAAAPAWAPAAAPAPDIRQPTVREVPLAGINDKVLSAAPSPHAHEDGQVGALSVKTAVKPALATTVRLSKKRAAALIAVVADEPFPAGTSIQVRVKDRSGWSAWTELDVDPDHGPDPGSSEARSAHPGSDPLLALKARKVRVRIDTPTGTLPKGTRLSLVKSRKAPSDGRTSLMSAMATVGQPPIVTRAQWGADESWRSRAPYYTDNIRAGFVHHTASTSNYSASQAAAQIRAIYAYHTKSLGHSDIDYNFVVDRFGRLYEGRYGGIDQPVLGGHTAGFNEHTFAVVSLGNFDTFDPPASDKAAINDSIARLFAWKLGMYGVNPAAAVQLVSAGYVKAIRYPKGTVASIPATSSHQTVNFTACPGKYMQAQMPAIRVLADRYSDVVLSAPSPTGRTVTSGSSGPVSFSSFADRAVSWQADVLSPCSDTPVRSYAGSTAGAGPLTITWDLLDSTGAAVLPATYTLRLSGTAADGTPVATVTGDLTIAPVPGGAWGPCANASRVVGSGPATTSVIWGRINAPGTKVVVLTGAGDDADSRAAALVAAPLARSLGAPLLLTPASSLAEEVAADIGARGAAEVLVVGGSGVVSDSVAAVAAGLGPRVTRLAGATAAGTAAAVATRMGGSGAVLVTPDGSPAHSLAGSALAAARGVPLLLAAGSAIPAESAAAFAGRSSVTVAASSALSDATVSAALGGIAWDRLAGGDVVGSSVAVAAGFPAEVTTAVVLPETSATWGIGPVAAASGSLLLFTASPVLSPSIADVLRSRPALRATLTPVGAGSLDDGVLGATSRVLLGLPWAPPGVSTGTPSTASTGPTATSKRKVYRANAKPEPVRKGSTLTVTAKVKAKFSDKKWRKVPAGVSFKVQFKASGKKKKYRTKAYGTTTSGRATATVTSTKSGRWRVVVGSKKSKSDYVKVKSAKKKSKKKR